MNLITIVLLFALTKSQCPANDPLCAECNGSVCSLCWDAFISSNGTCVKPSTTRDRCRRYASSSACLTCQNGYYVDGNGNCVSIPINNCLTYSTLSGCLTCDNGIRLANNTCNTNTPCTTPNCNQCTEQNVCVQCQPSYYLSAANLCVASSNAVQNCDFRTENNTCARCAYGYYDNNGACSLTSSYKTAALLVSSVVGLIAAVLA